MAQLTHRLDDVIDADHVRLREQPTMGVDRGVTAGSDAPALDAISELVAVTFGSEEQQIRERRVQPRELPAG